MLCPGLLTQSSQLPLPAWKQPREDAQSVPHGVTPLGWEALGLRFGCGKGPRATQGQGRFKKIKVISCCSCWQGPVRPEPGGLKQFHNPGDFLLIGIMKPITNIKSHSLKRQPEQGRDSPVPLGTAALAPPGKRCPPGTLVLRGRAWGEGAG